MSGSFYSHWTMEERTAFETWLKISIEMIERYCTTKETDETESNFIKFI